MPDAHLVAPSPSPSDQGSQRLPLAAGAVLFILVVLLYLPSLGNDFLYDDMLLVVYQEPIESAGEALRIFAERHWPNLPYYRPVARLSMVVQKTLHGNNPAPFHLFNAVLMGLTAVAFFALLQRRSLGISGVPAFIAAALFAMHPVASTTVYPICSGRETLMPGLFVIAATYAYLGRGTRWYLLALLAFALALLSKEQAVIVPGIFLAADLLSLSSAPPGWELRSWLRRYAPMGILLLSYTSLRWYLFGGETQHQLALIRNPSGPVWSLLYTLQTTLAPFAEVVYEPEGKIWLRPWRLALAIVASAGIVLWVLRRWTQVGVSVCFWLVWIALTLLPTANILVQESHLAERYGFLPLAGMVGILATLSSAEWSRNPRQWSRLIIAGLGIVAVTTCASLSFVRGRSYETDLRFTTQWLTTNPGSTQAHLHLGELHLAAGRLDDASRHLEEVLRIRPGYYLAHSDLGVIAQRKGDDAKALSHFSAAHRAQPNHAGISNSLALLYLRAGRSSEATALLRRAVAEEPRSATSHFNLGLALSAEGKGAEATAEWRRALELSPSHVQAHLRLGAVLIAEDSDEATGHFESVLAKEPDNGDAKRGLGILLQRSGDVAAAALRYEQAIRANPSDAESHHHLGIVRTQQGELDIGIHHLRRSLQLQENATYRIDLGKLLLQQGRPAEARIEFERALALSPNDAVAWHQLGNVAAQTGDLDRAVECFEHALELRPGWERARRNLQRTRAERSGGSKE